jgi:hypothetical protein
MSKLCVALNHPDAHQHGPTHALPITRCCKPQIRKSTHSHAMRNSNRIGHNHAQVRVEYQSCTTRAGQVRIVRPGIVIFGRQCIAASQSRSVTERTQADGVYLAAQCNCEAKDYQNVRFKVFRQGVYGTKDAYGTQDVYGTPNCGAPDCNSAGRGRPDALCGDRDGAGSKARRRGRRRRRSFQWRRPFGRGRACLSSRLRFAFQRGARGAAFLRFACDPLRQTVIDGASADDDREIVDDRENFDDDRETVDDDWEAVGDDRACHAACPHRVSG